MAARRATAVLVAVAMWCTTGVALAADDLPVGLIDGREHELRVRPVLGEVPPAPKRIPKAAQEASATAVASCDPAQVDALRRVATTPRDGDVPGACVVLPERGDPGGERLLLGPALLTGGDIDEVALRRKGKKSSARRQVVLELSPAGTRRWVLMGPDIVNARHAVTLDGQVVEQTDFALDEESTLRFPPLITVLGGSKGLPAQVADELAAALQDARDEPTIELARTVGMTELGRRIYGEANPSIDDKDELADDCPRFAEEAGALVFGCFDGRDLYVLRVDRPDLSTLMPVTAAHEMLHATYEGLPSAERRRIDRLVQDYLDGAPDARTHELLEAYGDIDDELRRNEAHSIAGTVERGLPRALERHYARYLKDRQAVVDQFEQYQQVFDGLDATLTRLEGEVQALEAQLSGLEGEVNGANAEAERLFNEIESLRGQGRVDESNNLVDAQNAAVNRANSLVAQYNSLVDQYNAKIAELDAASLVGEEIYQSLTPIEA